MHESTITADGRITLPEPVRKALSLKPGDKVRFFLSEGKDTVVSVRPATQPPVTPSYEGPPKVPIDPDRQIILPKSALEALSLRQGGAVRIFISEGVVTVAPVHALKHPDGISPSDGRPKMHEKEPDYIRKATIGKKGQLVLPEVALEAISLHTGDQVRLFIAEGEVAVMPVYNLRQMAGMLRTRRPPPSQEEIDEAITQAICERAGIRY